MTQSSEPDRGAVPESAPAAQPEPPEHPEHPEHGYGYMSDKDKYLARVRRIEGQARGIHRMIDEDQYCIDILTQISALTSALENVALALLEDHLRHCVVHAAQAQGPGAQADLDAKIAEAAKAVQRLVKS
ncbi:metal-sensitive transcriptional regulator [Piscicoccus intestinalis]|uniref:metal-sensitive transcriptional regulator n=1 Tax=Piscicoccus intestinalis TaxID=746033 RepID=UPI000A036090